MNHKMNVVHFFGNQLPTFRSTCKDPVLGLSLLQIVSSSYYLKNVMRKNVLDIDSGLYLRLECGVNEN